VQTEIFDGKKMSTEIDSKTVESIKKFEDIQGRKPKLLIIDPIQNEESKTYGKTKIRKATTLGIEPFQLFLSPPSKEYNPMEQIENIISEVEPDGIIVERPYPSWLDSNFMLQFIPEYLDIEGISLRAQGKNMVGIPYTIPATADACLRIILANKDKIGTTVCIINRSSIVGKPLAMALLRHDYTISICHSKTNNLKELSTHSDIVVTGIGKPDFIDSTFIKEGAAILDVGMAVKFGKIAGDVNVNSVLNKAAFLTPVPGGIGPVTTSVIMNNLLKTCIDRLEERLNF
jgi:methylenetetrahydrofolate dehydrogenase (NADP+)/methenyltetrahydrofolate cyclohydrolase